MSLLKRTVIPLAAAVVAAAVAMGGLQSMREAPPAPVAAPDFNALAEGVELRFHDDTGRLGYALRAARQTRFQDDRVEWRQPRLQWHGKGGANWRMEADNGLSRPGGDSLNLFGNVALRRDGDGNAAPLTLTTTSLDVDIPGEVVSTAAPVAMHSGPLRQNAAGFELKLAEDTLLLLGKVSGSHAGFGGNGGSSGHGGARGDDVNDLP